MNFFLFLPSSFTRCGDDSNATNLKYLKVFYGKLKDYKSHKQ